MKLQDRIVANSSYFRGMEMMNGVIIVKVQYENKWGVFPSEDEKIKVAKSEEQPNEYFYYGDMTEVSIDDIFDLIESTVEMNVSAAAKLELLNVKFEELKMLFAKEPLERLQTLTFELKTPKSSKKKKTTKKEKKEDIVSEETVSQSETLEIKEVNV